MGKLVVSVSFRYEMSSIRKRKGPQIDLRCQNFEVFVVSDAISVDFSKDLVLSSAIHSTTPQRVFLKRTLQCFASPTFQNDSKGVEKLQLFFVQLVYFLNHFGVTMSANVQQRLNSYSIRLSGEYLQISVGKWLRSDRKKSKAWKVLSISHIFSEFFLKLENFGN